MPTSGIFLTDHLNWHIWDYLGMGWKLLYQSRGIATRWPTSVCSILAPQSQATPFSSMVLMRKAWQPSFGSKQCKGANIETSKQSRVMDQNRGSVSTLALWYGKFGENSTDSSSVFVPFWGSHFFAWRRDMAALYSGRAGGYTKSVAFVEVKKPHGFGMGLNSVNSRLTCHYVMFFQAVDCTMHLEDPSKNRKTSQACQAVLYREGSKPSISWPRCLFTSIEFT